MTYLEKLKDPRWQRKRLEILNRDDFTCRHCGEKEKTLHVHHCFYNNMEPWEYHNNELITLCDDCHRVEHLQLTDLERMLLNTLRSDIENSVSSSPMKPIDDRKLLTQAVLKYKNG